jgi:hypothetical protein
VNKLTILLFIILATFGCKKDESPSSSHKLINCKIEYLFFQDDIQFSEIHTLNFPSGDSVLVCSYTYDPDHLAKITGGFVPIPQGTNLTNYLFSDYAYDSLAVNNNAFYLFSKFIDGDGITHEYSSNPTIFFLNSQNKLIKINKRDAFNPNGFYLNYIYSENQITETVNNGSTNRKFYIENKNLVKVMTERYNSQSVLSWKKEILFQDYDDNPNPFKDMYFVRGAYFRAFSENNYQSYTINEYCQLSDSTFGIYKTYHFSMPITYNSDSYPNFGEYE